MKRGKKCEIFPVRSHLSVVFKAKAAALCVIPTVNLAGRIQGMPVAVAISVAQEAARRLGVLEGSDSARFGAV